MEEASTFFQRVDERFSCPAQAQAILHVHVVRVEFDFNGLPNDTLHESGFGGKDAGVLELGPTAQVDVDA
jgi:hypothetical protein